MNKLQSGSEKKMINFSDIVDIDDEAFEDHVSHELASRLADCDFFRLLMTFCIVVIESILLNNEIDSETEIL
jgi:hypothetical protein